MNLLDAYSQCFKETGKQIKVMTLLFTVNFLLAYVVARPFSKFIANGLGNSDMVQNLFNFDYTTLNELVNQNPNIIQVLISPLIIVSLIYIVLSVFFAGGILHTLNRNMYNLNTFFTGAIHNFFRFLAVSLTFIIIHGLFALIVFGIMGKTMDGVVDTADSEAGIVFYVVGFVTLYLAIAIFWSIVSDYTKCYLMLNNSKNIFTATWRSFVFVIKHFLNTFFLKILLLITIVPLFFVWYKLTKDIEAAAWFGLISLFLFQQIFIFARVWLNVWSYAAALEFFTDRFLMSDFINAEKARLQKWDNEAVEVSKEAIVIADLSAELSDVENEYMKSMMHSGDEAGNK